MNRRSLSALMTACILAGCGRSGSATTATGAPSAESGATTTANAVIAAGAASPTNTAAPSSEASPPATAAPQPTGATSPAAACNFGGRAPGTTTVSANGRSWLLTIPAGYDGKKAFPLVLDFHGLSADATQEAAYSKLSEKGAARGFLVVTPESDGREYWLLPPLQGDLQFVRQLMTTLKSDLCIDAGRVYAAGISNGAGFVMNDVCDLKNTFAAVAPVSGINIAKTCDPGPLSIIAFHGTADPIIPYEGGSVGGTSSDRAPRSTRLAADAGGGLQLQSVQSVSAAWAKTFDCTGPTNESVASDVTLSRWSCREGTEIRLYTIKDGGHTWPGATPVPPLGPTTKSIDATSLMLDFFVAHPRSR